MCSLSKLEKKPTLSDIARESVRGQDLEAPQGLYYVPLDGPLARLAAEAVE